MLIVAVLIFATLVVANEEEIKGSPLLVVKKTVSENNVVLNEKLDVVVTVTNFGQSPAFDVQITDISPTTPQTKEIESLGFNESLSLSYVITPDTLGPLHIGAAEVTYLAQQGDEMRMKATSNLIREEDGIYRGEQDETPDYRGTVHVVTRDEYERINTKYIKETAAYLFLGAVPIFFPFFLYRTKQNQVDHLLREIRKKR